MTVEMKLLAAVGTVAHNRAFTVQELAQQADQPVSATRRFVKLWLRTGMLEVADVAPDVAPVRYSPTTAMWERVEALVDANV